MNTLEQCLKRLIDQGEISQQELSVKHQTQKHSSTMKVPNDDSIRQLKHSQNGSNTQSNNESAKSLIQPKNQRHRKSSRSPKRLISLFRQLSVILESGGLGEDDSYCREHDQCQTRLLHPNNCIPFECRRGALLQPAATQKSLNLLLLA